MSMSFHEKTLWVSLAALVIAFGGYFYSVYVTAPPMMAGEDLPAEQAGLFIAATVVLVVLLVAGQLVIAILDRRTDADERDTTIERRGARYGSYVLATGAFLALCTAPITQGNAVMAHVLLGAWVLAQAVEIIAQLVIYRRGC
jgi:hypothetical protein